jgi:hypothetical protein
LGTLGSNDHVGIENYVFHIDIIYDIEDNIKLFLWESIAVSRGRRSREITAQPGICW